MVRRLAWIALLCAPLVLATPTSADDGGIARLEAAVASHPDDPDLAWALARSLAAAGRVSQAVRVLDETERRWPGRHPEAAFLMGRLLAQLGRDEEAVAALQRAIELDPFSGPAHFHLALVLRRLGREEQALRHLQAASHHEPALRSEALLIRALSRLDSGDEERGLALLRETIDLDPDGEAARSAQLILGERAPKAPSPRRLRLEAWGGMEYDSNVTLDNGDIPGLTEDQEDGASVWGSLLTWEALAGERAGLTIGGRYDARRHLDLDVYDTHGFLGFFSARLRAGRGAVLRLDGLGSHSTLDGDPYVTRASLRPNLLYVLGERVGLVRLFAEAEGLWYEDEPIFSSLERDGYGVGGGLEHYVAVPAWEGAWGAWRFDYRRQLTGADPDLLGFEGDYDNDRYRGALQVHLPLAWRWSADASVSLAGEHYRHDNLVDFLNQLAKGLPAKARRRKDTVLEARLSLVRPLTPYVDLELDVRFFDRFSNTDVYSYDRTVAGMRLRFHTF